jgi:hypothetical protein
MVTPPVALGHAASYFEYARTLATLVEDVVRARPAQVDAAKLSARLTEAVSQVDAGVRHLDTLPEEYMSLRMKAAIARHALNSAVDGPFDLGVISPLTHIHSTAVTTRVAAEVGSRRQATERLASMLHGKEMVRGDELLEIAALIGHELPESVRVAAGKEVDAMHLELDGVTRSVRYVDDEMLSALRDGDVPIDHADVVRQLRSIAHADDETIEREVDHLVWMFHKAPEDLRITDVDIADSVPAPRQRLFEAIMRSRPGPNVDIHTSLARKLGIFDDAYADRQLAQVAATPSAQRDDEITKTIAAVRPDAQLDGDAVKTIECWVHTAGPEEYSLNPIRHQLTVLDAELAAHGDDPIAREAREGIAHNIARIDAAYVVRDGEPEGYSNFPDFGELSEVLADVKLLRAMSQPNAPQRQVSW